MSESTQRNRTAPGTATRQEVAEDDVVPPLPPPPSARAGWVTFAGITLALVGVVHVIEGFVGVLDPGQYLVRPGGLVLHLSYTAWGWIHLVLGLVLLASGVGVLNRNHLARVVGVVACVVSVLTSLTFVNAAPVWAIIVIALDVVFVYAITVHGGEVPVNRGSDRVTGFTGPGAP